MQKTLRMQMFVQDLPEDNGSLLYNCLHPPLGAYEVSGGVHEEGDGLMLCE